MDVSVFVAGEGLPERCRDCARGAAPVAVVGAVTSMKDALGIKVAPPEQQRKMALIMLGAILAIGGGACLAFMTPELIRHYTSLPAEGRVTAIEIKCHYLINRFNKRGSGMVTDLVDCAEARRVAAEVDHAMGQVREVAIVHVDYATEDGGSGTSWLDLPIGAARDLAVGHTIEIGYDPEYTDRIHRRASNPLALSHAGRYGITRPTKTIAEAPAAAAVEIAAPAEPVAPAAPVVQTARSPRTEPSEAIKTSSWYAARVILLAMAFGVE
jgi:hypothetical protein